MSPGSPEGAILVTAHAWYGDMIGGSFRLATEFAEYLATVGYDVVYVCCDVAPELGLPEKQLVKGVEIRRYAQPRSGNRLGRAAGHVGRCRRVVGEVLRERPLVAMSGHTPLQFLGAAMALKRSGAFRNYSVHSPFDDELVSGAAEAAPGIVRAASRVARLIERVNVRLAHRVQAMSAFTLATMIRKHGADMANKGLVAPGWVDVRAFRHAPERREARRRLGGLWDTDEPILFTLRRLEPRMGIDILINAAARLRDGPPFRVLIGGGGSQEVELARLIAQHRLQGRVHLLGQLEDDVVPLAYAATDCFVLPTRALECFGLIVLEAFAAGRPVIAARTAAIPELAARQGESWLYEPDDDGELADRMRAFLAGRLQPSVDARGIADEYDRARVLPRWEGLLFPDTDDADESACPALSV